MHFTIKPVSYTCNLKCDYCFYLPKGEEGFLKPCVMSDEVLESFTRQYIAAVPGEHVYFTWQGGEPLLAGKEFFKKAFALQKKYARKDLEIENAVQTNATLIDDEWCELFRENRVLLGVSIDGPAKLHDAYRKDRHNEGSHAAVLRGIECLKKNGIPFNTLTCINSANCKHPMEVYDYLKNIGSTFMQFSEVVETDPENRDFDDVPGKYETRAFSVAPEDYGNFMSEIFRHWVAHDIGKIVVRQFESIIARTLGMGHISCVFENRCPDNFVIEANGDIYECDQAVYPKYGLGNIRDFETKGIAVSVNDAPPKEQGVRSLCDLKAARLSRHKADLGDDCKGCMYLELCHGGCVKHRIDRRGDRTKTYFCEGYRILFKTMVPYLNSMVYLEDNKVPYIGVKQIAQDIAKAVAEEEAKAALK